MGVASVDRLLAAHSAADLSHDYFLPTNGSGTTGNPHH